MTKIYRGWRLADGAHVAVVADGELRPLRLRLDLANHSPTGFEWGYAGSGPAQLALALLADATRRDPTAMALHQSFKFKFITPLSRDAPWKMTDDDVIRHAAVISELPLMYLPDGSISRCCLACTSYLFDTGMIVRNPLGVFTTAPGVTFDDTIKAVQGRHHGERK
jgi:uncharacterized protein (DUF2249 family)